ncbi:MAG: GNAT family N-acetyltransferase [Candidatus Eremiobacteraeota bacterium]|nr:GNAT family N-acetyltransferase [Candidatus Eremiobacteraeota bacterium]
MLLREFTAGDEPTIHEYGSDPIVARYTDWEPNTPETTHALLLRRLERQREWPRDEIDLAIELRATGKHIGGFGLRITDMGNGLGNFGFVLNRAYWNQGFATEAARAVLEKTFTVLELHRLVATCDTRNAASARVLEKIGMRREAHFRQDAFQKGEWRDSYAYAILRQDWRPLRLPSSHAKHP